MYNLYGKAIACCVLASSTALAQQGLPRIHESHLWEAVADAPESCAPAASVLQRPASETTPGDRYSAALEMRRCLQTLKAKRIGARRKAAAAIAAEIQPSIDAVDAALAVYAAQQNFRGIAFGVGVGASFSEDEVVAAAEVAADDTIQVTVDESAQPRVILESHYYGFCKTGPCNEARFGVGPYFGIVAKDDKLISAISVGLMFGWQTPDDDKSAGFSVAIGAVLDSDVRSLADGFNAGEPMPEGETAIRFKTESRWSTIIFFTRTF